MLEAAAQYIGKTPQRVLRQVLVEATEDAAINVREKEMEAQQATYVPPPYPPCVLPLVRLQNMMVKDLKLETHHRGRLLFLKTITEAWTGHVSGGIQVAADDVTGEAVMVEVYIVAREERRKATDMLPKGSVFVIKEPYMYMVDALEMPELSCIRVDHVSDVIYLDKLKPRVSPKWSGKVVEIPEAMELKLHGDEAIKKEQYHEAIHL